MRLICGEENYITLVSITSGRVSWQCSCTHTPRRETLDSCTNRVSCILMSLINSDKVIKLTAKNLITKNSLFPSSKCHANIDIQIFERHTKIPKTFTNQNQESRFPIIKCKCTAKYSTSKSAEKNSSQSSNSDTSISKKLPISEIYSHNFWVSSSVALVARWKSRAKYLYSRIERNFRDTCTRTESPVYVFIKGKRSSWQRVKSVDHWYVGTRRKSMRDRDCICVIQYELYLSWGWYVRFLKRIRAFSHRSQFPSDFITPSINLHIKSSSIVWRNTAMECVLKIISFPFFVAVGIERNARK